MNEKQMLVDRMKNIMEMFGIVYELKKMFGGSCFMVDGKMCIGTFNMGIMARVHPEEILGLSDRSGASQMMHRGKAFKGYMVIEPEGFETDEELSFWIQKCLEFNPMAKASKKKKKK